MLPLLLLLPRDSKDDEERFLGLWTSFPSNPIRVANISVVGDSDGDKVVVGGGGDEDDCTSLFCCC